MRGVCGATGGDGEGRGSMSKTCIVGKVDYTTLTGIWIDDKHYKLLRKTQIVPECGETVRAWIDNGIMLLWEYVKQEATR
jgi:hypothetical protein